MGLKAWLIPQEAQFFDFLEKQMTIVQRGTKVLKNMTEDKDGKGPLHFQKQLKAVEHEGDDMVHDIYYALNQTFITPIDREDIASLTSVMDDVLDFTHAAVRRMVIYGINPTEDPIIKHFARILVDQTDQLAKALKGIRKMPSDAVEKANKAIHKLENEADDVHLDALGELFNGTNRDPITIMKKKEIYEMLETATDRAEDVANILGDICVKNA